ncbi:hypothetical protein ACWT_0873 [Actinoplanes sp. SE50]|uniref:ABC transporter permease n=1 Tax=unclassified Actinoplanes TaxID=2626549 RepID=UPI00023EC3CA|nr:MULTISPECIES: ABC transporter permease [unclassified Actinoplanes]AEV81887.1 hypothetical protein ACPL_990 [Actinoplanes sp. SE50/110]ATO80288.1 hypothetical protein ACWT_0873 [Actinoplanes sp. SE50]SLL97693.1 hypothetical protein ACSP50_0902 [Actinoplanes sp. SE50/110]
MQVPLLAVREFRSNWRRNAIFGAILFVSISVQLFTAIAATASRTAVESYATAVFGYAETYSLTIPDERTGAALHTLNDRLADITRSHPWLRPATAVNVTAYVRASATSDPSALVPVTLRSVTRDWQLLTPALADDDLWRTVIDDRRLGPAVLLDRDTAGRLGVAAPMAVTLLLDAPVADHPGAGASPGPEQARQQAAGDAPAQVAAGASVRPRIALGGVPVFGTYTELNKSLAADGFVTQNVIDLAHLGPQTVQVYWRCVRIRCGDAAALVRTAVGGHVTAVESRIDDIDQFRPVLDQQREEGQRFSVIVLVLGALAVGIVSTAFVEVRAPQFATLRALGASRPAVGVLALLENLLTAAVVGVLAVLAGAAASRLDPNRFNQISQVRLDHLGVPIAIYAQTIAITLAIGLLTGLAPAIRAYRAVRTS